MYKKMTLVLILAAVFAPSIATAVNVPGDQSTPAAFEVNYIIVSSTGFSVNSIAIVEKMNFTANRDQKDVEPAGQIAATGTPWATISNNGDVAQTFRVNLTTANPGSIQLRVSNFSDMRNSVVLAASAQSPTGWNSVPAGASVNLYAKANFTLATNTTRNLNIIAT
ncbi:Uncharacterised protein [uncultured archaeon]|nr:Uncharacterised protein [uncultured archaeon]